MKTRMQWAGGGGFGQREKVAVTAMRDGTTTQCSKIGKEKLSTTLDMKLTPGRTGEMGLWRDGARLRVSSRRRVHAKVLITPTLMGSHRTTLALIPISCTIRMVGTTQKQGVAYREFSEADGRTNYEGIGANSRRTWVPRRSWQKRGLYNFVKDPLCCSQFFSDILLDSLYT